MNLCQVQPNEGRENGSGCPQSPAFAALVLVTVALAIRARFEWRPGDPWKVVALSGSPQIAGSLVKDRAHFSVGQALVTDAASRARIRVAGLGVVDVEPGSRVRLIATHARRHQIALDYGTISARMWAPPFSLAVDTPSASLFDLGCAFTLHVERIWRLRESAGHFGLGGV